MSLKTMRFFSWWGVLLFSILSFAILTTLFPNKLLLNYILNDKNTSPLTFAYLKDLIKRHPDQIDYKISLIRQEIQLGNLNAAKRLITVYSEPSSLENLPSRARWKLAYMHYQILRIETFKLKPKSAKRLKYEDILITNLTPFQYSPYLTAEESANFGDDALSLNQPKIAMVFYKKTIKQSHNLSGRFYSQVGQAALFVSDYEASAAFYLLAMKKSQIQAKRRFYFRKAIDSLVAGRRTKEVVVFIQQNINGLENDRATILHLVHVALAVNQPQLAEKYISQVLQLKKQE